MKAGFETYYSALHGLKHLCRWWGEKFPSLPNYPASLGFPVIAWWYARLSK